jgi:hypothetical protein
VQAPQLRGSSSPRDHATNLLLLSRSTEMTRKLSVSTTSIISQYCIEPLSPFHSTAQSAFVCCKNRGAIIEPREGTFLASLSLELMLQLLIMMM